jgi:hypothetical protein
MAQQKFINKSPDEILSAIFKQYYEQFHAELQKSETLLQTKRIYDAGQTLELAFKNFFLGILPEYVGITRGFVFDSNCDRHSNEMDLIFYDKRYFAGFPINEQGDDALSYVSIDVVFGVAQVKKTLTMDTLLDATENINSVLNLFRKPIHNQMHYDMNFNNLLSYRNGEELNQVFSCILSAKNQLFYKTNKNVEVERTEMEIINDFLIKTNDEKYRQLRLSRVDLVYTLDGSAFVPLSYDHETKLYGKTVLTSILGKPKQFYNFPRDNNPLCFGFDKRFNCPENILGIPIIYLSIWCSQLIKHTPDIAKILKQCLSSDLLSFQNIYLYVNPTKETTPND